MFSALFRDVVATAIIMKTDFDMLLIYYVVEHDICLVRT